MEDDWTVDALGRPVIEPRPPQNGFLRAPTGAWGDQRLQLANAYLELYGDATTERGFLPMGRGSWVGDPGEPTNDRERRLANWI